MDEAPPAYEDIAGSTPGPALPPHPDLSSISLDGTLIYPTLPPATCLYELTHELDSGYSVVGILRLVPSCQQRKDGAPVNPRDKLIYEFQQPPMSPGTVEIVGKRRSTLPGRVFLRAKSGIKGRGWEVEHSHSGQKALLYRTRPSWKPERRGRLEWEDRGGDLIAEETLSQEGDESFRPVLKTLKTLDEKMMDILVTSWCVRLWLCNQKALADGRESEFGAFRRKLAYAESSRELLSMATRP